MTIPTPVLFGNFDEASGDRSDSIGSNTFIDNATVTSTTGLQGLAAQFTAANSEFFSIADNATVSAGTGSLALHLHVRFDSLANMGIAGQFGPAGQYAYLLYLDHGASPADRLHFYVSDDGTALTEVGALTFGAVTTGVWYDVACWFDITAGTINICINNGTVDSTAFAGPIFDSTADFYVGRWSSGEYLDGQVDLLGLWKSTSGPPLSSSNRTDLFAAGAGVAYPFPSDGALYVEGRGFTIPNRGTAIDPALEEWTETDHRIKFVDGRGDGVVTGCQITAPTSGFYVNVQEGEIRVGGTFADLAACSKIPSPADPQLPRIDVLFAQILGSGAGHVDLATGTPSMHPRPPALPVDTIGLAFVYVIPQLSSIISDCIVDKRCLLVIPRAVLTADLDGLTVVGFGFSTVNFAIAPFAGRIRNLYFRTSTSQDAGNSAFLAVYKNGSTTDLYATMAAADPAGTFSNTIDVVTVAAGDHLTLVLTSAGGTSAAVEEVSLELDPS